MEEGGFRMDIQITRILVMYGLCIGYVWVVYRLQIDFSPLHIQKRVWISKFWIFPNS